MDTGRISARYAKAAYDYAAEKGEENKLYEEMKLVEAAFAGFKSMARVMENPTVSPGEKLELLTTAAGRKVSVSFRNLYSLIMKNARATYSLHVALMYQEYYRKEKGIVIARLTSAEPVSEAVKARMRDLIAQDASLEVDFISRVNPELIGGFVLEVNSNQLDASVKSQLNKLKVQLVERNNITL